MNFYFVYMSPFCRSVMLTARAIGVNMNRININLMEKEHMRPEFLAINPQHCVPTLVDGDLNLWESRAICTYLVSQYGKDDALYPKDPKKRVKVDKLLYFDMGTLAQRHAEFFRPVAFDKLPPNPEKLERLHEALDWFNGFLEGHDYCTGNSITVADFVLVASISSIIEGETADVSRHPNILPWYRRCQSQMAGYEEENGKGAKMFGQFLKSRFADHK